VASNIERQKAEKAVKEMGDAARDSRIKLQQVENEAQAVQIKIETSESAMYSGKIHNPKELQDLQAETAALKRRLVALEDDQLESMMAFERSEETLKKASDTMEKVVAEIANQHASLYGEKTRLEKSIERYQAERNGLLGSISQENLKIYEQLRSQRKGVAVSKIEDDACQSCGASLRPAEVQVAKSPGKLAYCSSCGRILFAG